jgi:clan AA aspartic protease (TIGR02281 family)
MQKMKILCLSKFLFRNMIRLPFCLLIAVSLFAIQAMAIEIPLHKHGGVYSLPVRINGVITLDFILDTGASEVTIPADVVLTLLRTGTISEKDFLPDKKFTLADGSIVTGSRFNIKELEAGGFRISNVPALVVSVDGSLLLGQSFLSRASHWAIDNERQLLIISEPRGTKAFSTPNANPLKWEVVPAGPKNEVYFLNGPGIPGLEWGDSPHVAKDMMVKNDAVDRADVFCDGNKVVSKKARKQWE